VEITDIAVIAILIGLVLVGFAVGRSTALTVAFVLWAVWMVVAALRGDFQADWASSASFKVIGAVFYAVVCFLALTGGVVARRSLRRRRSLHP